LAPLSPIWSASTATVRSWFFGGRKWGGTWQLGRDGDDMICNGDRMGYEANNIQVGVSEMGD